jgi:hypothetical protein
MCVCGNRLDEDGAHLFLKCKVRQVWTLIGLDHVRDRMRAYGTAESVIPEILGLEDKKILTCTLWRWWLRRSKMNAEGEVIPMQEVAGIAR